MYSESLKNTDVTTSSRPEGCLVPQAVIIGRMVVCLYTARDQMNNFCLF